MGNFKEDIVKTEAFVFDVDGVFTDGGITPFGDGFIRRYYVKDGYAVSYASKLGYKICIITGGRGKWLQERFGRLRVTKVYAETGIDPTLAAVLLLTGYLQPMKHDQYSLGIAQRLPHWLPLLLPA